MKKYLISGYSGFVSRHFLEYLDKNETYASIKGLDIQQPEFSHSPYKNIRLDFKKLICSIRIVSKALSSTFSRTILSISHRTAVWPSVGRNPS